MTTEGIEKVKQIRDTEDQLSKQIEEAKRICEETLKKKREEYESTISRLTQDLQVKSDLALREKEVNLQKALDEALSSATKEAETLNLDLKDEKIIDRIFQMMKDYLSE